MNKTDMSIMGKFLLPKKIVVPGHGVDEVFYSKKNANKKNIKKIKKEIFFKKNEKIITTVGRLIKHKGIYEFAEAANIVRKKHPNTKFVIVGATDLENPTKIPNKQLTKIQNEGIVILKDRTDVREILFLSDIFVLATYMEAVPQVILEAMSMELPIIATDVSGCNERVINGKNGYLVEVRNSVSLADKIEKILEDRKKIKKLGQFSRALIEQKYKQKMMTEIISNYYDKNI
jgi:glycosyltransferase involved in cell wall biosynthesis